MSLTKTLPGVLLLAVAGLFLTHPARAQTTQPSQAELDKRFAAMLTNADLVGQYSSTGRESEPSKEDRYTILKAVRADGDNWVITAKVGYKGISLPMDITIPVVWAGDTAVMSLTDQKIPGFGTFTCRILFYRDQYAGTWSASDHGGLMWGRIERADNKRAAPTTKRAQ